jgi:hypothetical protein
MTLRRYPDISLRLIQTRLYFEMVQDEVAKDMKKRGWAMTASTYSTFENGTNPQSSVYAYWHQRGVDLNWLLTGEGGMLLKDQKSERLNAQDIVRLIQSLDHEDSVKVTQFLLAKTQAGSPTV